mmetsp:Transcript_19668/g.49397  ORF Transcript_19668/g.49397 Transcript_19668/m.49397 type:complete len:168 (+) Transcript_19668:355-858(+)
MSSTPAGAGGAPAAVVPFFPSGHSATSGFPRTSSGAGGPSDYHWVSLHGWPPTVRREACLEWIWGRTNVQATGVRVVDQALQLRLRSAEDAVLVVTKCHLSVFHNVRVHCERIPAPATSGADFGGGAGVIVEQRRETYTTSATCPKLVLLEHSLWAQLRDAFDFTIV